MKKLLQFSVLVVSALLLAKPAYAGFPNDFSDVVFIEAAEVKGWPATSSLNVGVAGSFFAMPYSKTNSWPTVTINATKVNANVWGFVKLNGVWHAGTWDWMRPGQTSKPIKAYGGCCHFKPPINNFSLVAGRDYGFMMSGTARSNVRNIRERSHVVVYRWGVGEVFNSGNPQPEPEPEPEPPVIPAPAINLLLNDSAVPIM